MKTYDMAKKKESRNVNEDIKTLFKVSKKAIKFTWSEKLWILFLNKDFTKVVLILDMLEFCAHKQSPISNKVSVC